MRWHLRSQTTFHGGDGLKGQRLLGEHAVLSLAPADNVGDLDVTPVGSSFQSSSGLLSSLYVLGAKVLVSVFHSNMSLPRIHSA